MEETADIIIIGAGICGLAAAKELTEKGNTVIILEAMPRTGGRINTFCLDNFEKAEAGPEFIHGDLPLTKRLVKKAGGTIIEYNGEVYKSKAGAVTKADDFVPHMQKVLKEFKTLKEDLTLSQFLETHFTGEDDKETRESVIRQAEGFDVADPDKVSVFALRDEWKKGHDSTYVIKEGYSLLADYFAKECRKAGCLISLVKEVKTIEWQAGKVSVTCADHSVYAAKKIIVTVSLGVLTAAPHTKGHIEFKPVLPSLLPTAQQMGFGTVVKVLMSFKTPFWEREAFNHQGKQITDLGFLITEGAFPVFWTGADRRHPILTGWAGGTRAEKLMHHSDEKLFEMAVKALAEAFGCSEELINEELLECNVFNWHREPYVKGAYSYSTPQTEAAKKVFAQPVEDTVYFAGEAFGETMGTVEAALESAAAVVKKVR